MEEFRGLAFEGVADELEDPSRDKKTEGVGPQAVEEDAAKKERERQQDGRDAQGVTDPVHGMLVAGGVLRDPLLVGAVAQHGAQMIHRRPLLCTDLTAVETAAARVVASLSFGR